MPHIAPLFYDLAIILLTAGVTTLVFKWLKQPLVLGYIVAGFFAGPHFHPLPTVSDVASINVWGEIGVVFLLFCLGLEFSLKKMKKVGGTAFITAGTELVIMFCVGYFAGRLFGWSTITSIFLGGMLTISSTTIILKAFEDLGLKNKKFFGVVSGILVVEDMFAVLQLVLLSTIAISREFDGSQLFLSFGKLIFFLVIWYVAGIFFIPTLLRWARKLMNAETLLIVSLGLCFGMVVIVSSTGFSPALGAFLMGSILSETLESEKIEKLLIPLKNLFGAIFFVTVGMLVQPVVIAHHIVPVMVIVLLVVIVKTGAATLGVFLSGQSPKIAIQSGFCLSQIGEFSFIIATLGLSLKVIDPFLYPVIVSVSIITTFTTPYMIKGSELFYNKVYMKLPFRWREMLEHYSRHGKKLESEGIMKTYLKKYFFQMALYSVIILSLILLTKRVLIPHIPKVIPELFGEIVVFVLSFVSIAPFVGAMVVKKVGNRSFKEWLFVDSMKNGPLFALFVLRCLVAVAFLVLWLSLFFSKQTVFFIALGSVILVIVFSSRLLVKYYRKLEARFLSNMNAKDDRKTMSVPDQFAEDIHLVSMEVTPFSEAVGKSIAELKGREKYGINIVKIIRGNCKINLPAHTEKIYSMDKLVVIGTEDQLQLFRPVIEAEDTLVAQECGVGEPEIFSFSVRSASFMIDKTIKETGLRDDFQCLVIGVERNGESVMNPESSFVLESGDTVWAVGNKSIILKQLEL